MLATPRISLKQRIFSSSGLAFLTMLVWEGVESLLEYAIAYFISSAITLLAVKLITTFLIVTATQTMLNKLQKFIMTFIKKLTYKKGEDKVEFLKKIWAYIKCNKCSIVVVLTAALLGASGTDLIDIDSLPALTLGSEQVVEAVIQEEDLIATEIVYELEPVIATEIVYESEPIIATEIVYSKVPVIATELTFIVNAVIYEEDGITIKYDIGATVPKDELSLYLDCLTVYNKGDIIEEGVILYNIGDVIVEGSIKYNVGDVIKEGIIKYNVGDVIVAKGTVLKEAETIPATNMTPYIYYGLLALFVAVAGVFCETPEAYAERTKPAKLKKQAKKEIAAEEKQAAAAEKQKLAEQTQKVVDAEKAKVEEEQRLELERIKAEIRATK